MSANLPNHFVSQFATNIQLLLQQQGSKLRPCVTTGSHVGKQASPVDQIASISMQPVTSRFAPMGRVDASVTRRWVFPSDFDLNQMIDSYDKLKLLLDPQSSYVQNAVNAAGRQMDSIILAAINGTNYIGETGATTDSFAAGMQVAVTVGGTNSGLNVAKLRQARRLIMAQNVNMEMEQFFIAVKARQHDELLQEVQVISSDFNAGAPVLQNGRLTSFMGFNFIHTELVEASGTSDLIPVFAKSGVYLGLWEDMVIDVSQRKDVQSLPWQAYLKLSIGATRLESGKIAQIACYNA